MIVCVIVVALEMWAGKLRKANCNKFYLQGMFLWLGVNVISALYNLDVDVDLGMMLFRMVLKALLGYMTFTVLMSNGRLDAALKSYVAGCAVAGLFTIAFVIESGGLEVLRQASYVTPDLLESDVNVIRGIARAGAGNVLPIWICVVLFATTRGRSGRRILLALVPYFAVLAMLALRREVLIEGALGSLVLFVLEN